MYIITGGSRGIGKALALHLAALELPVLIIGRSEKTLQRVAKQASNIQYFEADVSKPSEQAKIIAHLSTYNISGLIHNAGTIEPIAPITDIPADGWRSLIETNLHAPFLITQGLYKQLKDARVLHISSGAAHFAVAGWAAYCVSKAGLSMLTKAWQLECDDMAFASVMPGIIDTQMQAEIRASNHMTSEKSAFFHELKQQKKLISPETVASFLAWLLLTVDKTRYGSHEWDIYDTAHHQEWLRPPHCVPPLD